MPRISVFETHAEGDRWKTALIKGVDPKTGERVTQRQVAKQLGITEQAVGQHKKNFLEEIKQQAAIKKLQSEGKQTIIEEEAEIMLDEMKLIEKNIVRLETVIGPVYSAIRVLLQSVESPNEILFGMSPQARSNIALLRGLLVDSNRLLESLLRVKADIAPEVYAEERKQFLAQIKQINDFLFEQNPELLDAYETWLKEQKGESTN